MAQAQTRVNKADNRGLRSVVGQALLSAREAVTGIAVFSFFINVLMLTGPIYMLQVYDRVLISRSVSTLLALSVLMAAMYAFMGFLDFIRARVLVRVANKFERDLGDRSFKIWLKQGVAGQAAIRHSPLIDLAMLKQFLSGNGPSTFFDLPWIFIYILVIFALHWMLGVVAVVGTLILLGLALYNEFSMRKPMLESLKIRRQEQQFTQQSHRNADAIEAMGMGPYMRAKWAALNEKGAIEGLISSDHSGGTTAITKAFRMFIQSAILGVGGYLAVVQVITPGAMIAGSIILGRALAPVQMAIGQWRGFNASRDAYNRLNAFYDAVPEETQSTRLPEPKGRLTVERMVASPPGVKTATLQGIEFDLKPGSGLGVIGPSASGKSTLARLLVGIWLPQRGAVRLDGASFDQWNRDEIGPYIGYLPQNTELFDGTIGQNIARFNPNATDADIVSAAQMAGVHDLILHLPDGYDTYIGEGGVVLSGGQVQRIALARAVFGQPVLVVLDEPNASLDSEGDAALTQAIATLRRHGTTVIVMAHRPSAIAAVDQLLVLKEGKQVAFGPKQQVLKEITKSVPGGGSAQQQPARTSTRQQRPTTAAQSPLAAVMAGPKTPAITKRIPTKKTPPKKPTEKKSAS